MKPAGSALVKSESGGWLQFQNPVRTHCARSLSEVRSVIEDVEAASLAGRHCVGFVSYEAAKAFDSALTSKKASGPLVWFREFRHRREVADIPDTKSDWHLSLKKVGLSRDSYRRKIARIKDLLEAGATYQVNFTFPLFFDFRGDAYALFRQLHANQRSKYSVYLESDELTLCSVSPELFFTKVGRNIISRPMKGTAPRHPDPVCDLELAEALRASAKDAAENVMIVDMIRNDLGRIADSGSVKVSSLFDIEKYPTVYQSTSTVKAKTSANFYELLCALFPCASITGAPKVETMKIIARLERHARGVYTGAVGYVSPDKMSFNVGIRTVAIRPDGSGVYGTGSGVVWDSDPDREYEECLAKALVLSAKRKSFDLLETLVWVPGRGYTLSGAHLKRLARSASYFGFKCSKTEIRKKLAAFGKKLKCKSIVRLLLSEDGSIRLESHRLKRASVWRVGVAKTIADSADCFLYHKTTARDLYDKSLAEAPANDDMILFNEKGELTEACRANVVVVLGKEHFTPPVSCGLLAGTERQRLLDKGVLREKVLKRADLKDAEEVYLINSVRGKIPIVLVEKL